MSWNPVGHLIPAKQAYISYQKDSLWVFRTALDIFACHPGDPTPTWEAKLDPGQKLIGVKLLVSSEGRAITVEDFGMKSSAQMVALNEETGKEVWRQNVNGSPRPFGLAAIGSRLWLQVKRKGLSEWLVQLDASQGRILSEVQAPTASGILSSGDDLLIPSTDGLQAINVTRGTTRQLTDNFPIQIALDSRLVYLCEATGGPSSPLRFLCYDLDQEKEWGEEVIGPNDIVGLVKIEPMGRPGRAAALYETGFVVLDLERGVVLANVNLSEGSRGLALVSTPSGLVLAYATASRKSDLAMYTEDGEFVRNLEFEELWPYYLAYSNNFLTISGPDGVQFFEWGNQSATIATHKQEQNKSASEKTVKTTDQSKWHGLFAFGQKPLESGPKREKLQALVKEFLLSMQADPGSDQQREHGQRFNRLFDEFLQVFPEEDITKFAVRASLMGIPYEEAYRDVIYVRGLGRGRESI